MRESRNEISSVQLISAEVKAAYQVSVAILTHKKHNALEKSCMHFPTNVGLIYCFGAREGSIKRVLDLYSLLILSMFLYYFVKQLLEFRGLK